MALSSVATGGDFFDPFLRFAAVKTVRTRQTDRGCRLQIWIIIG